MLVKSRKTETYPLIIHAAGTAYKKSLLWEVILHAWKKTKVKKVKKDCWKQLTVITFNSKAEKSILEKSLDRLGAKYRVLGRNIKKWDHFKKISLVSQELPAIDTPYLMVLDGYDLLMLRDPLEAVDKFKKMKCEILFNGDKFFNFRFRHTDFWHKDWKNFYEKIGSGEWKYLNAGGCIAKTEFYRKFIEKVLKEKVNSPVQDDDQFHIYPVFKELYPQTLLDYKNEIFFNISWLPFSNQYLNINHFWSKVLLWAGNIYQFFKRNFGYSSSKL